MTNDIILGFLSGSLATEIVREIFRFLTRGYEFKKEVQKLTYEKKLQIAETVIAYHMTFYEGLCQLKRSYLVYLNAVDSITFNTDNIQHIINSNRKLLSKLAQNKRLGINAFYLYFDIKENDFEFTDADAIALIQTLIKIEKSEEQINMWVDLSEREGNTEAQTDEYLLNAFMLMQDFATDLKYFVTLIDKHLDSIEATVTDIKEQMKKY